MWLRAELRVRWRAWLAIAIVAGIGWGAVLTAVAGARRTESAFPRFVAFSRAPDALMTPDGIGYRGYTADVARLPEVAAAGPIAGMNAFIIDPAPPPTFQLGAPFFPLDGSVGHSIDRPKIIRGRMPKVDAPDEALASPEFVRGLGIDVGATVTLQTGEEQEAGIARVIGKDFRVRIVGVGVTQNEVFPLTTFDKAQPLLLLTPAAFRAFNSPSADAFDGAMIRLRHGASVTAFERDAKALLAKHPEAGTQVYVSNETYRPGVISRSMRPLVIALYAFAAALGVTLLLVLSQTLGRQILLQASEYPALRALGVSPRGLVLAAIVPTLVALAAGALIAVGVAVAASPLTPIGAARLAEPAPGVAIDATVLAGGAAALVILLGIGSWIPARKALKASREAAAAEAAPAGGRVGLADRISRAGLPVPASTGLRMALEPGRGATAVPVRTVVVGALVSMVALSATYTFGSSLNHAVTTPEVFGQRWDAMVDGDFSTLNVKPLHLTDDPSYAAAAAGIYSPGFLTINGKDVAAVGMDQLKGRSLFPTLLEGRRPRSPDEVVLGTSTLRRVGAHVGGTVTIPGASGPVSLTVVGRAVFPAFGLGAFSPTGLGVGAALTVDGINRAFDLPPSGYAFALVRYAPHPTAASVGRIKNGCNALKEAGGLCLVLSTQKPPEIETYAQVRTVPWLLAGLLAALAAATLGHGLLTTVRRRRRDLAILKTLGFVRRQVGSAVAWQASTFAVLALIGIPIGIAAGRWAWISLSGQLGIPAQPRVSLLAVGLTIPAGILLANAVAALPGRSASKTPAAAVLRTE